MYVQHSYAEAFQTARPEVVDKHILKIAFDMPTVALPDMALTINAEHTGLYPSKEIEENGWEPMLEQDPTRSQSRRLPRSMSTKSSWTGGTRRRTANAWPCDMFRKPPPGSP